MRLDHLLSRENFCFIAQAERGNTFPPGLWGFWGAIGYRNNQAGHWFLVRGLFVWLIDFQGFVGFWGFLGWLFVFWRVDVSVFVMLLM